MLEDYSRYTATPYITFEGHLTYGSWGRPAWLTQRPTPDLIRTFRVTSQTEGRPDTIALAIYGTSLLWWVLVAFNGVRNPLNWPRAGATIEYPVESVVFPELLAAPHITAPR